MKLIVIVLLIAILAGALLASAQPTGESPPQVIRNQSCAAKEIQLLRDAYDPLKRADQDWSLNAATAAGRLSELGQTC